MTVFLCRAPTVLSCFSPSACRVLLGLPKVCLQSTAIALSKVISQLRDSFLLSCTPPLQLSSAPLLKSNFRLIMADGLVAVLSCLSPQGICATHFSRSWKCSHLSWWFASGLGQNCHSYQHLCTAPRIACTFQPRPSPVANRILYLKVRQHLHDRFRSC
jgi:hypothetical protein